jgi:hypothetical protein
MPIKIVFFIATVLLARYTLLKPREQLMLNSYSIE